eukprot:3297074-Pyramimonas_sp.AAC.1
MVSAQSRHRHVCPHGSRNALRAASMHTTHSVPLSPPFPPFFPPPPAFLALPGIPVPFRGTTNAAAAHPSAPAPAAPR